MKKMTALVTCCIACIVLLAYRSANVGISVTGEGNETPIDELPVGMACGPMPKATDGSKASNGNFGISTFLSDEELSRFKYESMIFELAPGQSDTISHRHDCDVFVTVLEGSFLMGQEFKKPDTVRTGEIFHEHRNVVHSVSTNLSKDKPMKALVVFIRKDGRAGYTPLYPKK